MLANRARTPVRAASPEPRPKTSYHEIEAKTILNRVRGMPFDWSISPYRGCIHGCTYCYARESHTYLGYNNGADFEHEIVVKTNAAELLQYEIQHPRMRNQPIVTGTISDPYQPAEAKYRLTERMLGILLKSGNPVSVTTKSSLILRDLELLAQLAEGPGCSVNMTITTMDRGIARKLEPRAPSPAQRLNAVRQLANRGVRVGVFVGPVFPGLTDTPTQLEQLAESVADAGGTFLIGLPLRIGAGFAEPFLNATDRDFPEVASDYRRQARGNGMDKEQGARLSATFDELR
ncbi:MAG: radical SAM protein, partial [Thermomicrobiales bacterium]